MNGYSLLNPIILIFFMRQMRFLMDIKAKTC